MGDAGRVSGTERGDEEQGANWLTRCCLVVIVIVLIVLVVVPAVIWAAAILFAGGR